MSNKGYDKTQEGLVLTNHDHNGVLTGNYQIDFYGCWWEYKNPLNNRLECMIGEYPKDYEG